MKLLLSALLLTGFALYANESDMRLQEGKRIYKETCLSCHGMDGKVNKAMQLVVKPRDLRKTILDEEQTFRIIKYGARHWGASSDMMPAFGSVYDDEQLKAVAHYISKTFNPDVKKKIADLYAQSTPVPEAKKTKMLKRGKKIFMRNCGWCHGMDGHGDGAATRNPEKSIYPYDLAKTLLTGEQFFLYAKYGGQYWGTDKDDMPSWKKKYDDYTLKSVVLYIEQIIRKK